MKPVDLYLLVRQSVFVEGRSRRETARLFGVARKTVDKMCAFSVPPGYRRKEPAARPKLDRFTGIIDQILANDPKMPVKQRHTAKRIFERLKAEHGFTGGYTIIKEYVAERRFRSKEMFVPLYHPPGHAQVDFGEALSVIGGVECKIHFFCMDLPHSDATFVKAYPAETTEAFLDGHVAAFDRFGGLPVSILYNNTTLAVAKILGDGKRKRTRAFTELQSHYLFTDRFGRPGKGNDKGKVEGLVGYARRNWMVPKPVAADFDALNAMLLARSLERHGDVLRGHHQTIGERLWPRPVPWANGIRHLPAAWRPAPCPSHPRRSVSPDPPVSPGTHKSRPRMDRRPWPRGPGRTAPRLRTLLALAARPDLPCADADQMVARQLGEVERKIADLVLLRQELRKMTNCCGEVVAECQIIGSIAAPHDS
ncbi:transposase [Magnetospirillum gryphiswaldense MSR-1 v2]|uniref:Transposase n=3 Tax=Magnetospirillum gryphiswaldense TaxID=55518 RepID=V6F2C6_MAGGM|nr:transposase [Magnetospirillum gryphiswaldense MSR-1 v2]